MSSTPLPFQWNLTTLGKPIPPEYDSATVSPVHSEVLIPLNPKVSGTPCGMNLPRWNITALVLGLSAFVLALTITADSWAHSL
jgi:hypothetical protein